MTNLEERPGVIPCAQAQPAAEVEVLEPRDVPLGGPRAMTVRRTLPQRARSLIGAWCFVDHYGPDDVAASGGMRVPGHPHTGLQTVTWLFDGEVEHRDTLGTSLVIRPGEMNLMTSGQGIAHSEYSTATTTRLHGVQLWVALPDARRSGERAFEHYAAPLVTHQGCEVRVFLGELAGQRSPVSTWTPLLGAEVRVPARTEVMFDVDERFEHGVLLDTGAVTVEGRQGAPGELLYLPPGRERLGLVAGDEDARLIVLGGTPLGESIVMWWNFIARDHDEIAAAREAWQRRVAEHAARAVPTEVDSFGPFPSVWDDVLPAPELPTVRLKPRQ